jgi:hypothetical protein
MAELLKDQAESFETLVQDLTDWLNDGEKISEWDINMSNRKIAAKRIKERYGPFDLLDDDDSEYYEELVQSLTEWLDDGGDLYDWQP